MNVMGLTELDEQPKECKPSQILEKASQDAQLSGLSSLALEILGRHVTQDKGKFIVFFVRCCTFVFSDVFSYRFFYMVYILPQQISEEAIEFDQNSALIQEMHDP